MKRFQWTLGTAMVGVSVAQSAMIAHKLEKIEPNPTKQIAKRQALENARLVTMLNGLGLSMMALKKTSRPTFAAIPTALLITGTALFSGIIFYEAFTKDAQFHGIIKIGGSASIFGWFAMAIL